ncbi:MAG: hypothetical protein JO288_10210 [Hyphomicrobiales bacterium]|nr:hypothetical protein [Hyphomicrobiales bacterium]
MRTRPLVDDMDRTVHFWTDARLIDAESAGAESAAGSRYAASFKAHRLVRGGLSDGGLATPC